MNKTVALRGRRTKAYKALARKYAKKSLEAVGPIKREYQAFGSDGVNAEIEAAYAARFLEAAFGFDVEVNGNVFTLDVSVDDIKETDDIVSSIVVKPVSGQASEVNTAIMIKWLESHPGTYVVTDSADGYYIVGPASAITGVPTLA